VLRVIAVKVTMEDAQSCNVLTLTVPNTLVDRKSQKTASDNTTRAIVAP
jgi:hypothetical protein